MDGNDFIQFAGKLAASNTSGGAGYRSAASRAYYGAYHLARQYLNDCGFFCHSANEHQWVQRHFFYCTFQAANDIGRMLGNLHETRKEADYDLQLVSVESQSHAKTSVMRASEISARLTACQAPANLAQVKFEMEVYRTKANVS